METSTQPVEDTPTTHSTESNILQIKSSYLDLKFPPEINQTNCSDHAFSIRGYAAEMRKKNPKASFPFASSSSLNNIEELLPPMQVPNFRWWHCQECRRKIEDASPGEQPHVHSNCSNVLSNDNATMILSETQSLPNAQLTVDINAPPTHQETNDAETAAACDAGPIVLVIDKVGPIRDGETCVETGNLIAADEPENIDGNIRQINRAFQQPADGSFAEKTLVLAKRKDKQILLHDRLPPRYGEQSSSVKNRRKEGDMHAASENDVLRLFGTSSAAGKRENYFKNSRSPQVQQKGKGQCAQITSPISKSRPFHFNVGLELSLNSFEGNIVSSGNKDKASSSKSVGEKSDFDPGQCSLLPAPEIELFRKKSRVRDLNERLARNSNSLVDRRNRFLTKEMKEKTSEVEGLPQEINKRSNNMNRNRIAQGSPDEVPKEIVEFMAKNPYQDAGRNSFQHGTNNDEVQGKGAIMFTKGFPALTMAKNYSQMTRNNSDMFPRNLGASSVVPYMPFGLGIQRQHPSKNPESQNRGKTIKADEIKKRQEAHTVLSRPGNSEPNPYYVNNNISASQLLYLMNGTSLSKPFAPCGYSPTERSLFQRLSQLGAGTFCVGESSSGGREARSTLTRSSDSIPYLQVDLGRRSENANIPRQEQYCVTNQNPAEFVLPDSQAFTVGWKDLKPPPKRKYSRGNPADAAKPQRQKKGR